MISQLFERMSTDDKVSDVFKEEEEAPIWNALYALFNKNTTDATWRILSPCPYYGSRLKKCPFGANCVFPDCPSNVRNQREHTKPLEGVDVEIYAEFKASLVRRSGNAIPNQKTAETKAVEAPKTLDIVVNPPSETVPVEWWDLPLDQYMLSRGFVYKSQLCKGVTHENKSHVTHCGLSTPWAHSPSELFKQFQYQPVLDYYKRHLGLELVPLQPLPTLACSWCHYGHLTHLYPSVQLYDERQQQHRSMGLIVPYINVWCDRCHQSTVFNIFHGHQTVAVFDNSKKKQVGGKRTRRCK